MAEQFILLPARGVRGRYDDASVMFALPFARSTEAPAVEHLTLDSELSKELEAMDLAHAPQPVRVAVIDSVHEDGPKLVELSPEDALALRNAGIPARLEPIRDYRPTAVTSALPIGPPPGAAAAPATAVSVRCAQTQVGIPGVAVTAIVDATLRLGDRGIADANGDVDLRLGPAPVQVDELRVERPAHGWWGAREANVALSSPHAVALEEVDLHVADALRHFYGASPPGGDGSGVRIGVIDTGIDDGHPDLTVSGGRNTVTGEPSHERGDNGVGHGTHIAGIIAAHGSMTGLAPASDLWSYRVYPAGSDTATNYAIIKALIYAADDGCHLVNLSLGGLAPDQALKDAIDDAKFNGTVVIAAAGNDYRNPVAVPGCYATAVTALGRKGTYPGSALEAGDEATPAGTDPDDFLAAFSNDGQDVDFTAPGVGIVSTVPGGYAPERGTSMAAAAVTGMAARLLSAAPAVVAMPADATRSAAILNLLGSSATKRGFGFSGEGFGML